MTASGLAERAHALALSADSTGAAQALAAHAKPAKICGSWQLLAWHTGQYAGLRRRRQPQVPRSRPPERPGPPRPARFALRLL